MFARVSKGPKPAAGPDAQVAARPADSAAGQAPVSSAVASLAALSARLNTAPAVAAQAGMAGTLAGRGLPVPLREGVERLSGVSLAGVTVHRDSAAPAQLRAHAFTRGNDIHIAPGQERHLPHEAWHVVQQRQGRVRPTLQLRSVDVNDDPLLEREADVMGARALRAGLQGAGGPVMVAAASAGTPAGAVAQRVPDESEAERLQPENTDQEWVRFDVPGDGSCLFHSVFLSAMAVQLRAELLPNALAGMTPAQVAARVLDRAATVLGTDRRGLRAALDGYQRRERQGVAQYWRDHLHENNILQELVGDIRSIITVALRSQRLFEESAMQAEMDVPQQADVVIDKDDVLEPKMGLRDGSPEPEDESPVGIEDLHERLATISGSVADYTKSAGGRSGSGLAIEVEAPNADGPKDDWLAAFHKEIPKSLSQDHRGQDKPDPKRSKSAPHGKKTGKAAAAATNTLDRFRVHRIGGLATVGHDIALQWAGIVGSIEDWPLGNRIPVGGPLDRAVKLLILGKMRAKVMDNRPPVLSAADFAQNDLEGLVDAYIDAFASSYLFAGQAALDALRARHGLTIRSHIIADNQHVLNSEDADAAVNVLQLAGHFNVLIGPFVRGHLHGRAPELRDLSGLERSLPVGGQLVEPVASPDIRSELGFSDPLLGISALAVSQQEKGRHRALCRVGDDWLPLDRLLEARIDRDDILRSSYQRMREFVGTEIEALDASPLLGVLADLKEMLENASNLAGRFQGSGEKTGAALADARTIFIRNDHVYTGDGLRLATVLRRMLSGPLGNAVTHRGAAVVHEALQTVMAAEAARSRDPRLDLARVSASLRALAGSLGIGRLDDALRVRPMEQLGVPFLVLRPSLGQKRRFLARNNAEERYDLTDTYTDAAYEAEARRQAAIQEKYLNRMTVAEWMMHRDLFGIRKPDTRKRILAERDPAYLQSLTLEMMSRAYDAGDQGARGGKGDRLMKANDFLARLVPSSKSANALDYLMKRREMIQEFRRTNVAFDPALRPDPTALKAVIEELLTTERFTGRVDEDGEPISEGVARDLVGRSNQQVEWRKRHQDAIDRVIETMAPDWMGLFPNHQDEHGRGLHILHNPDQVAGGERDIPDAFDDIADVIGPGIVNSALGGTWALPLVGQEAAPTLIERLTNWIVAHIPEAQWPLLRMNVVLQVQFDDGARVVPGR